VLSFLAPVRARSRSAAEGLRRPGSISQRPHTARSPVRPGSGKKRKLFPVFPWPSPASVYRWLRRRHVVLRPAGRRGCARGRASGPTRTIRRPAGLKGLVPRRRTPAPGRGSRKMLRAPRCLVLSFFSLLCRAVRGGDLGMTPRAPSSSTAMTLVPRRADERRKTAHEAHRHRGGFQGAAGGDHWTAGDDQLGGARGSPVSYQPPARPAAGFWPARWFAGVFSGRPRGFPPSARAPAFGRA